MRPSSLLGNGDGTLQPPQSVLTGEFLDAIAAGDFNEDGFLDLAVSGFDAGVRILFGNGDGSFPLSGFIGSISATLISLADVNNDSHLDIITNDKVLLGSGDGTFQPALSFDGGGQSLSLGDLNEDSFLDIAFQSSLGVHVLLGAGDGNFSFAQLVLNGGGSFNALALSDLNGDAHLDIAVPEGLVKVLLGSGDGNFQDPRSFTSFDAPVAAGVVDANGDGRPDLVMANCSSANINLLLAEP
jgi:hypothetical protein